MQTTNQQIIDRLCVKFSVLKENVGNVKEAIGSGTLQDAIREAEQLSYSANSLVAFLRDLQRAEHSNVDIGQTKQLIDAKEGK